ncbi:MAG: AtpZ/AtpI family protein [Armatimonadota bacterium]|nr:AtpZ/AtpI family protein [Armatimonadota bacterium]MCX7776565.1 AtpZ/AtpI family protein [Armatimonadota bacterium]MDW8026101.1 AtpZ/AtpI family protein [Armatimonadota bacterium]
MGLPNDSEKRSERKKKQRDAILVSSAGSIFVGAVVFGWLVGSWFDKKFNLDGIGVAAGILIGFAAGAYEVIRTLSKLGKDG